MITRPTHQQPGYATAGTSAPGIYLRNKYTVAQQLLKEVQSISFIVALFSAAVIECPGGRRLCTRQSCCSWCGGKGKTRVSHDKTNQMH